MLRDILLYLQYLYIARTQTQTPGCDHQMPPPTSAHWAQCARRHISSFMQSAQ